MGTAVETLQLPIAAVTKHPFHYFCLWLTPGIHFICVRPALLPRYLCAPYSAAPHTLSFSGCPCIHPCFRDVGHRLLYTLLFSRVPRANEKSGEDICVDPILQPARRSRLKKRRLVSASNGRKRHLLRYFSTFRPHRLAFGRPPAIARRLSGVLLAASHYWGYWGCGGCGGCGGRWGC